MKMSDLISLQDCGKRYKINNYGFQSKKGQYYYSMIEVRRLARKLLSIDSEEYSNKINDGEHYKFLNNNLDDSLFPPLSKEERIKELANKTHRYVDFIRERGMKILRKNLTQDVKVSDKLVTVTADFIYETPEGIIEVVKLKRGKPVLSYRARKSENMPKNNIELFLLQTLGKHLYPDRVVEGSLHHLTGKGDNSRKLLQYELKKGHNIVKYSFNSEEKSTVTKEIIKLFSESKLNLDEYKTCSNNSRFSNCPYKHICNYVGNTSKLEEVRELEKASENFRLTPSQRKAVMADSGMIRINAGAGAGKTTVVALRVVELILAGTSPSDILLITFTNKGAEEMKEKIIYWLKQEGIEVDEEELNITTFNSWGHEIIKEQYKELGFTKSPKLIEKVDKYDILIDIIKRFPRIDGFNYKNPLINFRYTQGAIVRVEKLIDFIKSHNIESPEEYIRQGYQRNDESEEDIRLIFDMYREFNQVLKKKGYIEYQDQINLVVKLFEQEKMNKYSYKHVIVDEFQDSDNAQLDLILFLSNQPGFKSLMVVGDDSQSIFGFRDTSPENILNFHKFFDDVMDINIVKNFRSTPEILDLANGLNDTREDKIDKTLVSGMSSGKIPELSIYEGPDEEYRSISSKIKRLIEEKNKNPKDIAIIARTKNELFEMANYLIDKEIPYIIDVPEPLYNNPNIHIVNSLLSYINNQELAQGVFEYMYSLTNGFRDMNDEEIKKIVDEKQKEIEYLIKEKGELNSFYLLVEEMQDEEISLFIQDIKERNYEISELIDYMDKFIKYEDMRTVGEKNKARYKAVTLTTAHTSKGKEFDIVFVLMSRYSDNGGRKAVNEEVRTLFVAITRAKKELYVSTQYKNDRGHKYIPPLAMRLSDTGKIKVS